jgi:hypothetical protein
MEQTANEVGILEERVSNLKIVNESPTNVRNDFAVIGI